MKLKLDELIIYLMSQVAAGHTDEETGEHHFIEEASATWGTQSFGDFQIVVRRPKNRRKL